MKQARLLQLAFFLSGAGALAFEAVWFSQAALVVGNSVWAAALVVAAFMGGLALGNGLAVMLARRWSDLVRGYAWLEVTAAVCGALLVVGFPHLPNHFRPLFGALLGDPAALNAARLGVAFGLMAVPATALGATLPLLTRPLEATSGGYGIALGRLYGVNTLGALLGVLAAELLLIPALGLRTTGMVAAACNLSAAAIAFRLPAIAARRAPPPPGDRPAYGRLLTAAFLAGAALLGLEVVGFRFLLLFLDGTTLVFATMLAVVLAGIGAGGLAGAHLARRGWLSAGTARALAAGAAVALVGGYASFDAVQPRLSGVVPLSLLLLAPAAVLSGILFTALGTLLRQRAADAAMTTGALALANTLGALLGALLAGLVLLPWLGVEVSIFAIALLYGIAVLVIPTDPGWLPRLQPALIAALALALFPFGKMTGTFYRQVEERFGARLVAAREGLSQTAFYLVHEFLGEPLFLRLATNSYSMASTAVGVQRYMKLFAWLPAALHPRMERVLVLCFGVGSTARAVADLPEVKQIDVVDVSREILEMAHVVHADPARHPLLDSRVTTHVEDARFFLHTATAGYDLITGEPPPPKMAGVASLYTREYFELMRSRLNPGGLATYWLPAYLLHEEETLAVIRAFCDAFDDCSLWSGLGRDWILMGSRGGVAPVSREHFARLWRQNHTAAELRRLGIDSPAELVGQFMADADALRELTARVEPLVDDYPRRIAPRLAPEAPAPAYVWLMDSDGGRQRLETSAWRGILPFAPEPDAFRRRGMLDAVLYPPVRGPGHNAWRDLAELYRTTGLVELPRWLLGSGASAAQIAARVGETDPVAVEHVVIDALANRRAPPELSEALFRALTPRGQAAAIFHHCLVGNFDEARELLLRASQLEAAFTVWQQRECTRPPPPSD